MTDSDALAEEVAQLLEKHPELRVHMRSCWECNEAHEWMKNMKEPFTCPWCGSHKKDHDYEEHNFVPMGCDCGRMTNENTNINTR